MTNRYTVNELQAENERLRQRVAQLEAMLIESERAETTADDVQPSDDTQPIPLPDVETLPPPANLIRINRGRGYSSGCYEVTGKLTLNGTAFVQYRNGLGNIATIKVDYTKEVA